MKLVNLLTVLASLTATVHSAGFSYSSGWAPGQTETARPPSQTGEIQAGKPPGGRFSWSSILTSGPIGGLLARSGINVTSQLEEAQRRVAELPWDTRIPMIRDDNYEELILNEPFATPDEENSRVWFLIVTVTSSQRTGLSALVDGQFNEAYNTTLYEKDLPNVRWGRIDYLNVTRLTTKWAVWRAPMLIVAKDRGKTLRFFSPQQMGVKAPQLREFLLQETWQKRNPWSGPWAPGGSREDLLDRFAILQENIYYYMVKIPRWMYLVISGGLGSVLIQFFHRKPKPTPAKKSQAVKTPTHTSVEELQQDSVEQSIASGVESKRGSQRRKGGKK